MDGLTIDPALRTFTEASPEIQKAQLKLVSQEFESILVAQMFRIMRETVPNVELFGDGHEMKIYEDLLHTEFARSGSRTGGFGFADLLYRAISPHIDKAVVSSAGDETYEPDQPGEVNND